MSVWSDLTAKFETGSKVVADKARELSQVANLRAQILGCDNVMYKNYRELGKAYYEAHKNDIDSEYEEIMNILSDAELKKADLLKQLEELKQTEEVSDSEDDEDTSIQELEDEIEVAPVEVAPIEEAEAPVNEEPEIEVAPVEEAVVEATPIVEEAPVEEETPVEEEPALDEDDAVEELEEIEEPAANIHLDKQIIDELVEDIETLASDSFSREEYYELEEEEGGGLY